MDERTPSSSRRSRSNASAPPSSSTPQPSDIPWFGNMPIPPQTSDNPWFGNMPIPPQTSDNPFFLGMPTSPYQPSSFFAPPHLSQMPYTAMLNHPSVPLTHIGYQQPQQEVEDDEDDDDNVPETQPDPQPETQPGTRRNTKQPNRKKAQPWTPAEEVALVRAYVDISEDNQIGNAQRSGSFWERVRASVQRQLNKPDGYRNNHQVHSKYRDINTKVTKFAAIYNNLVNNRRSGMSDANILQDAHYRYREQNNGTPFHHEKCWDVLKTSPRWSPVPLVSSTERPTKRSKTPESTTGSSSAHFFDLNDVDDDDDDEDDDNEVEAESIEPTRPVGRNRGKRAASTSTGTGSKESIISLVENLSNVYKGNEVLIGVRKEELELHKAERMQKDYEFYIKPTDGLSGGALTTTLKMKETIRQKYGWDPL